MFFRFETHNILIANNIYIWILEVVKYSDNLWLENNFWIIFFFEIVFKSYLIDVFNLEWELSGERSVCEGLSEREGEWDKRPDRSNLDMRRKNANQYLILNLTLSSSSKMICAYKLSRWSLDTRCVRVFFDNYFLFEKFC